MDNTTTSTETQRAKLAPLAQRPQWNIVEWPDIVVGELMVAHADRVDGCVHGWIEHTAEPWGDIYTAHVEARRGPLHKAEPIDLPPLHELELAAEWVENQVAFWEHPRLPRLTRRKRPPSSPGAASPRPGERRVTAAETLLHSLT